ncbi:hypothetical protein B0H14DRAFT_3522876 [Mycena olivaceomarginata]|nr:hypothetical protein B0H14DRAFT_3522876 [Mycena olivaceomarginata]
MPSHRAHMFGHPSLAVTAHENEFCASVSTGNSALTIASSSSSLTEKTAGCTFYVYASAALPSVPCIKRKSILASTVLTHTRNATIDQLWPWWNGLKAHEEPHRRVVPQPRPRALPSHT